MKYRPTQRIRMPKSALIKAVVAGVLLYSIIWPGQAGRAVRAAYDHLVVGFYNGFKK